MNSSKIKSINTQSIFKINNVLEIIDQDNDLRKWVEKERLDNKNICINDLKDQVKYPILYLLGLLKVTHKHAVEDYFEGSFLDTYQGAQILLYRGKSKENSFIVVINLISDESGTNSVYLENQDENFSFRRIDKVLKHFNNQDKLLAENITDELNSAKRQLSFRENQLKKTQQDLRLLLENNTQASIMIDHLYSIVEFNNNANDLIKRIFNVTLQKNIVFTGLLPKENIQDFKSLFLKVLRGKKDHIQETFSFTNKDAERRTYQFDFHAVQRFHQTLNAVTVLVTDVTDQLITRKVKHLHLQLMKVAMNPRKSRTEIATYFIKEFEAIFPGTMCSILVCRNGKFKNLSSPSLPDEYVKQINDSIISPSLGTCGEAAHSKNIITTPDLFSDPKWEKFRWVIQKHNLRSCTSYPIINSSNTTVATFSVYRNAVHSPGEREIEISKQFAELLSLISEMQEHKRKHEILLNSIQDGFFSLNEKFKIDYWNKTAEKITKISEENALGRNLWDVFPALEKNVKKQFINHVKNGKNTSITGYFPLLEKWFELIIYPKGEHFVSVFFRDVSERIRKEQQLIEANDRLEKVMNAANDAIYELDLSTNIIKWSSGYTELFGHTPENSQTSGEEWFNLVHPEQRDELVEKFRLEVFNSDSETWSGEYSYMRSNGSFAHVMDRGHISRDKNGNAVKLIGAVTDISYHKEYEESLVYLNGVLKNRAEELRRNNEELEQFAYLASHDLQEPLRTITNFISQIERKYKDKLDEKGVEYVNFVIQGADRMRRLITDILEYSKLGKADVSGEIVHLNKLIENILSSMSTTVEENNAIIEVNELPHLKASETHLYQIFSNLISNAIKYRKKEKAPKIQIYHREDEKFNFFYIKDNGMGITPKFHEKIFEIFQRLHNNNEYSGTGIGLALVKKCVDQLKGEISVESYEGGSIFIVKLPKDSENQSNI